MPKISEFESKKFETQKEEILIGIISDTHIPERKKFLPEEIGNVFKNVDLIIHTGDINNLEVLKELEKIAPVFAVYGNWDLPEVREKLPPAISLKIFNWKIGILHSPFSFWLGSHFNFIQKIWAEKIAKKENFNILIFGHTHRSYLKELEGKKFLMINPGSATLPLFDKPSVAILKINKNSFEGKIIYLK